MFITKRRADLTDGLQHQFDYSFFKVNILDKMAIYFGIYTQKVLRALRGVYKSP